MATALLTIRKVRKVPLSELGRAVNLTKGQLSRIERGQSRPSAKTVERLYEYFEGAVSREDLMFPEAHLVTETKKPVRSARPQEAR